MNNTIVPVKKVRFGSKNFMFFRTLINIAMREREQLKITKSDPLKYRWLSNTIRAMADMVFFSSQKRIEPKDFAPQKKQPVNLPKPMSETEKKRAKKMAELEKQSTLF